MRAFNMLPAVLVLFFALPAAAQVASPVSSGMQSDAVDQTSIVDSAAGQSDPADDPYADTSYDNGFDASELDPWERINRPIFRLNNTLDRVILRPTAVVYSRVVPSIAQRGVSNFFTNLQQPITSLNLLLQGHPIKFTGSLGRFLLNSTLGLGGIFDPATHAGIPAYDQDFGQTLHRWGWKNSRYVMLPLFGPATVRDGVGKGLNTRVSPITWFADEYGAEYSVLYGVNARARGLSADAFLRGGGDEYLLMRDAYLQFRRCQLVDCSEELPGYLLPDYEFELPDVESIRLRR